MKPSSFSSSLFALVFGVVVMVFFTTTHQLTLAAVTDNSVLSCETTDVLPAQNITCRIYLRDELQEPTTSSNAASIFSIRVLSDIGAAVTTVSPVQITKDPTVVLFTVSSTIGTRLRIDGYVSATGLPIRNTGAVVLVLEVPATNFGEISCDSGDSLSFRSTTKCVASAVGANGLPAYVTPSNFFLSEEHGDGSFQFINGNRALQFSYTAPTFPSMTYTSFLFRLGLLSGTGSVVMETTLSLKVVYPQRPPTGYSRLRCGSSNTGDDEFNRQRCFVSAMDALGPVAFNADDFIVEVKRSQIDTSAGAIIRDIANAADAPSSPNSLTTSTFMVPASEVSWSWTNGGNQGVAVISFTLAQNSYVFDGQISVRLRNAENNGVGSHISGSPATMGFGVAPTPVSFNVVRCTRSFGVASPNPKTITCLVSVSSSVAPDPRYLKVEAEDGTISCKRIANSTDLALFDQQTGLIYDGSSSVSLSATTSSKIIVCYTPPASISTTDRKKTRISFSAISLAIGKEVAISGSPIEITLYPAASTTKVESDTRIAALVTGVILFGSVLIVGFYFNFKHAAAKQRQIARLAEHQRHALEHTKLRPLFKTASGASVQMVSPSLTRDSGSAFSPSKVLSMLKPAGSVNNLSDEEMKAFGHSMSGVANEKGSPQTTK